jgi:glycosyltransferase involved in cell wall biosynthesis
MSRLPIAADTVFEEEREPRPGTGVSVVVTLFNYANFVISALDSVREQTHGNLELIVVNDRSTDASEAVVKAWMAANSWRFARTVLLTNVKNYGLATSRNTGFDVARNEFVFVLDADNQIYPRAVARLLAACELTGDPAAYSQLEMFDEERGTGTAYVWDPDRLARYNFIDAMALVRRSVWQRLGGYGHFETAGWEDYDLWCRFVEHGLVATFVPQILCRYRVHGKSMLRTETNQNVLGVMAEMLVRHPWLRP